MLREKATNWLTFETECLNKIVLYITISTLFKKLSILVCILLLYFYLLHS